MLYTFELPKKMTSAVEFILISKSQYIRNNSYSSAILNSSNIKEKSAQLSILNRFRSLHPKDETLENEDHETEDPNQKPILREEILEKLALLSPTKYARAEKILDIIEKLTRIVVVDDEKVRIDSKPTNLSASVLLYNLQQPNKKFDDYDYFKRLNILSVNESLVINSDAKTAIRKNIGKFSRKRVTPQKQSKTQSKAQTNKRYTPEKLEQDSDNTFTDGKEGFETTKEDSETEEEKSWDSFSE